MHNAYFLIVILVVCFLILHANSDVTSGTEDGSEQWGYVTVRPKAHLFWWYYKSPQRIEDPSNPWPIIIWLQGGPGASGVALGNFQEIGPLDTNLKPRNSTWLQKADLLFVDNPVGTGFSYTEDESLAVKTDVEAAADLTTLLKVLFNGNGSLANLSSPLFIVAESYGGKFAVTLGISALQAIEKNELKLQLGGVVLGDSWISAEDFVFSWGPLLKDVSRIDNIALEKANSLALKIQQQLAEGKYEDAELSWEDLEVHILETSSVDFYNFMLDDSEDPLGSSKSKRSKRKSIKRYSTYLNAESDTNTLMNGLVAQKLKIIPPGVTWGGQEGIVFPPMAGEFMKPRIADVDELLAKGVNVTIYNGQTDLICATKGVDAWVDKLKWDGLQNFLNISQTPLYCGDKVTKGFFRSYKNLFYYKILGAGHYIPVDQPCMALKMIGSITNSPKNYIVNPSFVYPEYISYQWQ